MAKHLAQETAKRGRDQMEARKKVLSFGDAKLPELLKVLRRKS